MTRQQHYILSGRATLGIQTGIHSLLAGMLVEILRYICNLLPYQTVKALTFRVPLLANPFSIGPAISVLLLMHECKVSIEELFILSFLEIQASEVIIDQRDINLCDQSFELAIFMYGLRLILLTFVFLSH